MTLLFEPITYKRMPFDIRRLSIDEYKHVIDLGILYGDDCELIDGFILKQGYAEPGRTETQIRPFTLKEYHGLIEAGVFLPDERLELIWGYLHPMSPKRPRHAEALSRLTALFYDCIAKKAIIRAQDPITLPTAGSEPEPDLVLARPRRGGYADRHPGPGDILLVVEVADSSLTFDSFTKTSVYAAASIAEYWIVNLIDNRVDVYRDPEVHADGTATYRFITSVLSGASFTPLALPRCLIQVDRIIPTL